MPRLTVLVALAALSWIHLALTPGAVAQPAGVAIGPAAGWVEQRPLDLTRESPGTVAQHGGHYLLLDFQANLRRHESYFRQAVRIVSQEGVASFSDVMASFDPRDGALSFHHIRVLRDGRTLDRLEAGEIRSYQRENRLEFGIYDGLETAVINLHDVRIGDVVDFAFTVRGVHPLLEGHVAETYAQQSSGAIGELNLRVIADPALAVTQHTFDDGEAFAERDGPHGREYRWRGRDLPAGLTETAVPSWWNPGPRVSLTSFDSWRAVADWARPLYRYDAEDRSALARLLDDLPGGGGPQDRVLAAIRFVQDEVRYLGREEGLWSLQPRPPARCLDMRFGDCKDKSLLLVALLRELGVEAFPVLVSTVLQEHVADEAPSPLAFDHCVVGFDLAESRFYVDPTLDHQGGGFGNCFFPAFGRGLPVNEDSAGLVTLPDPPPVRIEIAETFEVPGVGAGDVIFQVETAYHGEAADSRRAIFAGGNAAEMGQGFTRYYSAAYPGIEQAAPIELQDGERETTNILVLREHYLIHDAWSLAREDSGLTYFEVYPLELENFVHLLPSPARVAPYDPGSLVDISITSTLHMPEDWPVLIEPVVIEGDGYAFFHEATSTGSRIDVEYRYRRWLRPIAAEDTPAFLAAHDEIMNQLGLSVFEHLPGAGFVPSPTAVLLIALVLIGGGTAAAFVLRLYDPEPATVVAEPRAIGGWLVLPAIGFVLTPIRLVLEHLNSPELLDESVWSLADQGLVDLSPLAWQGLLGLEAVGNATMLVLVLLVLAAFFGRRTGAPRLAMVYLVASSLFLTVDTALSIRVLGEAAGREGAAETVRAWIGTAIWVPYFLRSRRVRETFVRRAPGRRAPVPAFDPPPP